LFFSAFLCVQTTTTSIYIINPINQSIQVLKHEQISAVQYCWPLFVKQLVNLTWVIIV